MENLRKLITAACIIFETALIAASIQASSGDIDTTFANDGSLDLSLQKQIRRMAIQSDDKIVLLGELFNSQNNTWYIGLWRYNANGSIDTSLGGLGFSLLFDSADISATDIVITPNGKFLIAGSIYSGDSPDFFVARVNSDGSLDTTFGTDGIVTADYSGGVDIANKVGVRTDGKIVLVGSATFGAAQKFAVARFNSNGTLDTTFSGNGKAVAAWNSDYNVANCVAFQPSNKIVVGGVTQLNGQEDIAIAVFNNNGTLDTTFGNNGKVIANFGNDTIMYGVLLQPNFSFPLVDRKIIAIGDGHQPSNTVDFGFIALAKFGANGSADTTFGNAGRVTASPFNGGDNLEAISKGSFLQPDGKIVVVTAVVDFWGYVLSVTRFNSFGSLDIGFGDAGHITRYDHEHGGDASGGLQSSGKILFQGTNYVERLLP